MKRITLSVGEDVIRAVRLYAAERGSTVSALVREFSPSSRIGRIELARRAGESSS